MMQSYSFFAGMAMFVESFGLSCHVSFLFTLIIISVAPLSFLPTGMIIRYFDRSVGSVDTCTLLSITCVSSNFWFVSGFCSGLVRLLVSDCSVESFEVLRPVISAECADAPVRRIVVLFVASMFCRFAFCPFISRFVLFSLQFSNVVLCVLFRTIRAFDMSDCDIFAPVNIESYIVGLSTAP